VPLSEHEQRLLDQIERALYQEDPKFASTVRQTDLRSHMKRRLVKAALVLVLGFGVLLFGVTRPPGLAQALIGIAGFALMVGALVLAMTAWKRMGQGAVTVTPESDPRQTGPTGRPARPPKSKSASGGFMTRFEERWKRRWDERGQ
jgi:hypothetical protein